MGWRYDLWQVDSNDAQGRERAGGGGGAGVGGGGDEQTAPPHFHGKRPSGMTVNYESRVLRCSRSGCGGCPQFVHGRSRMTVDPRIHTIPGRSTLGVRRA